MSFAYPGDPYLDALNDMVEHPFLFVPENVAKRTYYALAYGASPSYVLKMLRTDTDYPWSPPVPRHSDMLRDMTGDAVARLLQSKQEVTPSALDLGSQAKHHRIVSTNGKID